VDHGKVWHTHSSSEYQIVCIEVWGVQFLGTCHWTGLNPFVFVAAVVRQLMHMSVSSTDLLEMTERGKQGTELDNGRVKRHRY